MEPRMKVPQTKIEMRPANFSKPGLKRHNNQGMLSAEIAFSATFLIVFAAVAADIGYSLYGADFNDRACRDAVRAAAQTTNLADATKKANTILVSHQGNPLVMSGPSLDTIVYQDYSATPAPANTSPFVTVTTHTKIFLPFSPLCIQGVAYGASGSYTFVQSYTFPIVRIR